MTALLAALLATVSFAISADKPFRLPADLSTCLVFSTEDFRKKVQDSNRTGECDVIRLRSATDMDIAKPFWIQFDEPLPVENAGEAAKGHPLVIVNDTGRPVEFRTPHNGGCAVILRKPNAAIVGFLMLGAVCRDADPL